MGAEEIPAVGHRQELQDCGIPCMTSLDSQVVAALNTHLLEWQNPLAGKGK